MSSPSDFPKLSTFVEGIVDRKVRAIALGVTTSTGYFKNLLSQASIYALAASNSAAESSRYATQSQTSATQAAIIYNQFTSMYLGISVEEPQRSSIGNFISRGAFYIRSGDNRLRVAQSVSPEGVVTYTDATVAADPGSIEQQIGNRYLSLENKPVQNVQGPVNFGGTVTVPAIPEWETASPPQGSQVLFLVNTVNNRVADEANRASAAEAAGVRFTQGEIDRAKAAEAAITSRVDVIDNSRTPDTGVTRNGAFNNGTTDWYLTDGLTWIASPGDSHGIVRAGPTDSGKSVNSHRHYVREDRVYRLHVRFASRGFNIGHYAGMQCFDEAGNHLGNIYMPGVSGQKQPYDWNTFESNFEGHFNYGQTPVFVGGASQFVQGTVTVELLFLPNYDLNNASGPIITDLDYLYLEDVTEVTKTNRSLTTEVNRAVARENDLFNQIQQERTDRFNGDTTNLAHIDAEAVARRDGDLYCERLVNDERAARLAEVQQERVDRNGEDVRIINRLGAEESTRYIEDQEIRRLLGEEGSVRLVQDQDIRRLLTEEGNVRYREDIDNQNRIADEARLRTDAVNREADNRYNEDVGLSNRIIAEGNERYRVDQTIIQQCIDEGTNRYNEDQAIRGLIATEKAERLAEVQQERVDRVNADSFTLDRVTDEANTRYAQDQDIRGIITNETNRAVGREAGIENFAIAINGKVDQNTIDIANLKANTGNYGSNAYGSWERRGGITEMWGTVIRYATSEVVTYVTLPLIVDNNVAYTVTVTPMVQTQGIRQDLWAQLIYNSMSASGFGVQYQSDDGEDNVLYGFTWTLKLVGTASAQATTATPGGTQPSTGGGGGGGGGTCPEEMTPVLLANAERTGPGEYTRADSVKPGDYVWTRHEITMEEGAYEVTHARVFDGVLWQAEGYYRATKGHPLYINNRWVAIDEIGVKSGEGKAVAITVADAHTYYTLDLNGEKVLNHNIKPVVYE